MSEPQIAQKKPYLTTLPKKGKRYMWCACGLSDKQPFCDGSHKGTGFEPVPYVAQEEGEEVLFCGCKHTRSQPLCDGTHNNLDDSYEEASAEEIAATAHFPLTPQVDGKAPLDGGCYVRSPDAVSYYDKGGWHIATMIGIDDGATALSQFHLEANDVTAPLTFGDSEAVLGVLAGRGRVEISGQSFDIGPETGVYVKSGEAIAVTPHDDSPIRMLAAICPVGPEPEVLDAMPDSFDKSIPDRTVPVDPSKRESMADRFYQVLIGEGTGSAQVTQFIGEVPKSRAAYHRHLYEEAITILSGEGFMWTEGARAEVHAGDVIFLPHKQPHSLECTDPNGMRLMGIFYPSGSPAVNY